MALGGGGPVHHITMLDPGTGEAAAVAAAAAAPARPDDAPARVQGPMAPAKSARKAAKRAKKKATAAPQAPSFGQAAVRGAALWARRRGRRAAARAAAAGGRPTPAAARACRAPQALLTALPSATPLPLSHTGLVVFATSHASPKHCST